MSKIELNTTIFFLIRSTCVGIVLEGALLLAKNNAYLSLLISGILSLIVFYLYYLIIKKNVSFGLISNIIKSIFLFILSCILFTNLITFITSEYLYNTPKWFVGVFFLIPLIYITFFNEKVIGRCGLFLFYISIFLFMISFIFLFFKVDYSNFLPFMKTDFKDFGLSIFNSFIYIITPLLIIMDLPVENRESLKFRDIIPGYVLGFSSIIMLLILIIGIYGYRISLLLDYPSFQILKRITSISFFERAEHFIFMQWIFDTFICISFSLNSIKKSFNNKYLMIIVFGLLLFLPLFFFKNNVIFTNFIVYKLPIILFIILILIWILKKRSIASL